MLVPMPGGKSAAAFAAAVTPVIAGVCQRFRARDFSVPGSGCLSGLSQPRYLKLFRPVYPWPAPNRTYRALPGLILRVPVIFPFSAIRVTPPCPPGPPDVHSGSVI
jgi:hypothetical protein